MDGARPNRGAVRRISSAATGTAIQPAVRRSLPKIWVRPSSSVTMTVYFGSWAGKAEAKVAVAAKTMPPRHQ